MSKKKRHNEVSFKPYVQNQSWLFPPSLGEMIPAGHKVRLVSQAIDGMSIDKILSTYKGGGTSSYHPKMLLKVLVYGYIEKIYSSRGIEKALRENVCFMWLSGMQQPDHNTLNRFRRHRLNHTVKEVFAQVLLLLIEQGYVQMEDYYIDGTKMESVANRYTFVWAKNVQRYKAALLEKISNLIAYIEQTNEKDQEGESAPQTILQPDQPKLNDSEAVEQTIKRINENLETSTATDAVLKKKRSKLRQLQEQHLPKLCQYEEQERLLNGRSSYSKTDHDATFMRTKEDHLCTGQLKPSYNIQVGTEQQFIINYTVHQSASDMKVLQPHMDDTLEMLQAINAPSPKNGIADAGYGSKENYEYFESKGITAYVKYPGYYKERKGKLKHPFDQRTLYYNEQEDYWVCPMGQRMSFIGIKNKKLTSGTMKEVHCYEAQNCSTCPLKGACSKAKGNRILEVDHSARLYRQKARERLATLKGIRKRQQRNIDVEPVFGHIKHNRHYRRFLLTSLEGVSIEMGLLAIAHNFTKWHLNRNAKRIIMPKPSKAMAKICPIDLKKQNLVKMAS